MIESPLKTMWTDAGATFEERCGSTVVTQFSDPETEYNHIRNFVGLTDFSYAQVYRMPEETAVDFLDAVVAGNVARTRFGRVVHTLLADEEGHIQGDCYVANNDEEFILICEPIIAPNELDAILDEHGAQAAEMEKRSETHVLLGIDGFDAWKVAKELFGADVLGLPYLSVEVYPFEGEDILLFRAGKTSEFGYLFSVPNAVAVAFAEKLRALVEGVGGGLCGVDVHHTMRLEGRFFNVFKEGTAVRDPLTLGLQWMIDFDKESFRGSEAIVARREAGLTKKIIGVATDTGGDLSPRAVISNRDDAVAEVVASCHSHVLDCELGLAVFPVALAYAGLAFSLGGAEGPSVRTVSMPPILPKSLTIRLDEM